MVVDVLPDAPPRVSLAERDHALEGLGPDREHESFGAGVEFRALYGESSPVEDRWISCLWAEADDVVSLLCGAEGATRFGDARYDLVRHLGELILTHRDEAAARLHGWPVRLAVSRLSAGGVDSEP